MRTPHHPNMQKWIDFLRVTEKGQAEGCLHKVKNGEHFFCCLGIGCTLMPNLEVRQEPSVEPDRVNVYYNGLSTLAPKQFAEWLGIDVEDEFDEIDLLLDVDFEAEEYDEESGDWNLTHDKITASWMNDGAGLSFAQIADMVDYFGIKSVTT